MTPQTKTPPLRRGLRPSLHIMLNSWRRVSFADPRTMSAFYIIIHVPQSVPVTEKCFGANKNYQA